jgi:hypothetical protein
MCLSLLILSAVSCEAQERQPDKLVRAVQWSVIATQAADAITTMHAIQGRVGRESNPAMGWVAERPFVFTGVKLATGIGIAYAVGKVAKRNRTAAIILGCAVSGTIGAIAIRNARIR